jgi:hypothetical protein
LSAVHVEEQINIFSKFSFELCEVLGRQFVCDDLMAIFERKQVVGVAEVVFIDEFEEFSVEFASEFALFYLLLDVGDGDGH